MPNDRLPPRCHKCGNAAVTGHACMPNTTLTPLEQEMLAESDSTHIKPHVFVCRSVGFGHDGECEFENCGLLLDHPIHIKPKPRRWVVEFTKPIRDDYPGWFNVNRDCRIIREVKPITRPMVYRTIFGQSYTPDAAMLTHLMNFLRELGIDVED